MNARDTGPAVELDRVARLRASLNAAPPVLRAEPHRWLVELVAEGLDQLPPPGTDTATRWHALALVAAADLSLAKLYEGHTDALAIRAELGADPAPPGSTWGVWAAESAGQRTLFEPDRDGDGETVRLSGRKHWCSGADEVSHALLTAWTPQGRGPQLVAIAMDQAEIEIDRGAWQAIGMGRSASVDLAFHGARAALIGAPGDYLVRPGFWQGGAGIASCWFGGARAIGTALHDALLAARTEPDGFSLAALGRVDVALQGVAAMLREAAAWVDAHPRDDARTLALRVRLAAEDCAQRVIDEATRALGAGALCRNARFARLVTDLPVFLRQSHAARDHATLGSRLLGPDRARGPGDGAWA